MIKRIITPYLLIFGLLLNTTATLFAAQEEQPQEKVNPSTTEQITIFTKDHKKEIIAVLGIVGLGLLYYKFGLTPKEEKEEKKNINNPENSVVNGKTVKPKSPTNKPVNGNQQTVQPKEKPRTVAKPTPTKESIVMNNTTLDFVSGDICTMAFTQGKKAAIVNAANDRLEMKNMGGVCIAIYNAANGAGEDDLQAQCTALKGCPTGQAKATNSGTLKKYGINNIIHAVGPIVKTDELEEVTNPTTGKKEKLFKNAQYEAEKTKLLQDAYTNSLRVAEQLGIQEIAFPSISTNIFGFPKPQADIASAAAVQEFFADGHVSSIEKVLFVTFAP